MKSMGIPKNVVAVRLEPTPLNRRIEIMRRSMERSREVIRLKTVPQLSKKVLPTSLRVVDNWF